MRILSITIVLLSYVSVTAQRANIWYFGQNAGIDFNSGAAVPLLDGELISFEGCASICDGNGDLLFYTNGGRTLTSNIYRYGYVFDRDHDEMPNGDLEQSGGCNSATQGSLIVQDPGNTDQYYLFTTDCQEHGLVGGLRYAKVDVTLNNGLGDVATIGTLAQADVSESMIGVRHANGTDVWVIVHGLNVAQFHAFLVTANGISAPFTTTIGPNVGLSRSGLMSANGTGTKIHYGGSSSSSLMDFDPATGVLSNILPLQRTVFGSAFAPAGQYLYTCENYGQSRRVFQYDLLATDIPASEQIIGSSIASLQAMQLGPDGKIYLSRQGMVHLGVVNNPDLPGMAADYQDEGFSLAGRICTAGLPGFVNDLLAENITGIVEAGSMNESTNTDNLHITPNPATDHVNIVADAGLFGKRGVIDLFDATGKRMHSEQVNNFAALQPMDLSAEWKEGLYLVMVRVEGQVLRSSRVVVER